MIAKTFSALVHCSQKMKYKYYHSVFPGVCRASLKQQTSEHNQHSTHCQQHSHTWRWWKFIYSWQLIWRPRKQLGSFSSNILVDITGILNTTVNFTYQFLRKKFAIFSQVSPENHYWHHCASFSLPLFSGFLKYPEGQLRFPVWSLIPLYANFLDINFLVCPCNF